MCCDRGSVAHRSGEADIDTRIALGYLQVRGRGQGVGEGECEGKGE